MKTEDILKKVIETAGEFIKNIPANASVNTSFQEIPHWSSLNHAYIINRIEKQFNIEFELEEMIEVRTLGEICELIRKKIPG
jgi:acyl carrier protein